MFRADDAYLTALSFDSSDLTRAQAVLDHRRQRRRALTTSSEQHPSRHWVVTLVFTAIAATCSSAFCSVISSTAGAAHPGAGEIERGNLSSR
ncbi:MAG: hypothetical protein IPK19_42140 [Chloroflexi bacterium]|nr:hypothetical protein [Chloroflexota bacterium]